MGIAGYATRFAAGKAAEFGAGEVAKQAATRGVGAVVGPLSGIPGAAALAVSADSTGLGAERYHTRIDARTVGGAAVAIYVAGTRAK